MNPKGEVNSQLSNWSFDRARRVIAMRDFETLGFVGTYALDKAASAPDRWALVVESLENVPKSWKARYVVTPESDDEYQETLELDPDGKGFKSYVTNRLMKVASPT